MLGHHMWLGATGLDMADTEHFQHCRKLSWGALLWASILEQNPFKNSQRQGLHLVASGIALTVVV